MSVDILPSEDNSEHHKITGVETMFHYPWKMIIAHPPCTYLANSGVHWLGRQEGRVDKMYTAAMLFKAILEMDSPLIAVENPIMHKYAKEIIGSTYNFSLQPYEHGEPVTKRTCFWTRGLPPIEPTKYIDPSTIDRKALLSLSNAPPGLDRWKIRSRTMPGVAQAIADQWGDFYLGYYNDKKETIVQQRDDETGPEEDGPGTTSRD